MRHEKKEKEKRCEDRARRHENGYDERSSLARRKQPRRGRDVRTVEAGGDERGAQPRAPPLPPPPMPPPPRCSFPASGEHQGDKAGAMQGVE